MDLIPGSIPSATRDITSITRDTRANADISVGAPAIHQLMLCAIEVAALSAIHVAPSLTTIPNLENPIAQYIK
jgi:hypothetical protein